MKILFLTDGLAPFVIGGMQQHSTMMVKHLALHVDEITVMHCGYPNEEPASDSDVLGVLGSPSNVSVIGFVFNDRSSFPGHYVRASKKYSLNLYNNISNDLSSFDVIYAQGFTGYAFIGKHKKLVTNLHGLNMFQKSFTVMEMLEKRILRSISKHILVNSNYSISLGGILTDILIKLGVKKIIVCPNGIEHRYILESRTKNEGGLMFLFIGRNDKAKGFSMLLEALKMIKTAKNVRVIGPLPENKIRPHLITYLGEIKSKDQIFELIDTSDVLVVPSLSEGMPTVILEAMARGKAVIATDVGAVSELVSEENGVLIQAGSVEELSNALTRISKDDLHRAEMFSIQKAKNLTWERVIGNLLKELI